MLEEFIHLILPSIIAIIELIGIFVVAVSAVQGFYHYLRGLFGHKAVSYTHLDVYQRQENIQYCYSE